MKLVYWYMAIFLNFSPTSYHLHLLQVEYGDSNSRLVVDEDDYDKFRVKDKTFVINAKKHDKTREGKHPRRENKSFYIKNVVDSYDRQISLQTSRGSSKWP